MTTTLLKRKPSVLSQLTNDTIKSTRDIIVNSAGSIVSTTSTIKHSLDLANIMLEEMLVNSRADLSVTIMERFNELTVLGMSRESISKALGVDLELLPENTSSDK